MTTDDVAIDTNTELVHEKLFNRIASRLNLSNFLPEKLVIRIILYIAIAWLPLLFFSILDGKFYDGNIAIPFLFDTQVHVRFLLALPLLIFAEVGFRRHMPQMMQEFKNRHLIQDIQIPLYDLIVSSSWRLRNSSIVKLLTLIIVYAIGLYTIWWNHSVLDTSIWYSDSTDEGLNLTLAGYWYMLISLPILQYLLIRWYWRLFVWIQFLCRASLLKLNLVSTHPDRAGGLGFLANSGYAFVIFATVHGLLFAGNVANRILFAGAALDEFIVEISVLVLYLLCVIIGPLVVFSSQLAQLKQRGLQQFGGFAARYTRDFDNKWLQNNAPVNETLLGHADIQSLADLGNSFEIVQTIHLAPVTSRTIFNLVFAILLPMLPLLLTIIPLNDLLIKILSSIF